MHDEIFMSLQPSIGSSHFLDNLLNTFYGGINLNASEKNRMFIICKRKMSTICHAYCSIMKFMAQSKPFHEFLFNSTIINDIEPTDWWKSQTTGKMMKVFLRMTQQLFNAQASASVKRIIVII